ncbi:MAG: DUF4258 domain-containing protein [bacterium]
MKRGNYALTSHAIDEMQPDELTELDIEEAVLNSKIVRLQKDHLGRTKYTLEGLTKNLRKIRVICRFSDSGELIVIITVYEII